MVECLIYCTIAHCCYMNAQYYNQVLTIIPNCDMSTNIKTLYKVKKEKINVRGKFHKILLMIHTYCQIDFIMQSTQKWWFKDTECELYSVYGGIYEGFRLLGTGRRILRYTTTPPCLLSVVLAAYSVQRLHTLYTGFTHMQVMEIRYVFECSVVRLEHATLLSYSSLAERWPQVPHKQLRIMVILLCSICTLCTLGRSLLSTKFSPTMI